MIDMFLYWVGVAVSLASVVAVVFFIVAGVIEYVLEKFDITMKFIYFVGDMRRNRKRAAGGE